MSRRSPKCRSTIGLLVFAAIALSGDSARAAVVWAIDDGEKIKQDAAPSPLASGTDNPVWSPGQPMRLFAMKNETVAFQVVVAAEATPLSEVTVELDTLATTTGAKIANAPGANDPTVYLGRPIERFVEHFFEITRASGGKAPGESLRWAPGSGPAPGKWLGKLPDALIPVEVAPSWAPYPMTIAARTNGIVWVDVTVGKSQAPGLYKGDVVVRAGTAVIATLPIELDVVDVTLADRPVRTMLHYDRRELERRIGSGDADGAERHLFRLLHRHRLSPMHSAMTKDEVARRFAALDGTLYTSNGGYEGPAEGMGDGVLALGAYGGFGEPDATKLATVETIAELLSQKNLFVSTDAFVYAVDEDCESNYGKRWKSLIAGSKNAYVKNVRVGWTCSEDATKQVVDVVMQAATFDAEKTKQARAAGKEVWAYNGRMPQTGTFVTDAPAISLRVNGWLSGMFDIGRWFYWEITFWYDDNRGGKGPYDPFVTAETFHNKDGDYSMGDGVLVYPGKQVDKFTTHSIGMNGVVASIRLKNWHRGIQDAGYLQLARAADAKKADAIAKALLPVVNSDAKDGKPPSWPETSKPWFDARKALLTLIPRGTNGGVGAGVTALPATATPPSPAKSSGGCSRGCDESGGTGGAPGLVLGVALVLARRGRRRLPC